ncbi:hypothetical protein DPMN_171675 [Dreissena polymorpha]|uniref:Uncharacterized protein n=1 Tax=Dreissena polymorpha TaxID=45954 RepID=A0A9D4IDY7_DREPO|nr:hypothetical protein DPMN_171675 [Dreissena polymorpha]
MSFLERECKNKDYGKRLDCLEKGAAETYLQTLEKEASEKIDFEVDRSSEM